jgi:hypothetical protein
MYVGAYHAHGTTATTTKGLLATVASYFDRLLDASEATVVLLKQIHEKRSTMEQATAFSIIKLQYIYILFIG